MLSLELKMVTVRNHSVLAHAVGLVNAVKLPVVVGIVKIMEDEFANSKRMTANLLAKQRKIQSVMERQRKRDVAAAYGEIIPFDENDILKL